MSENDTKDNDNQGTDSLNIENKKDKKIEWSDENENILVEWSDIAQCYKWLNARAHAKFSYMHAWFTIPAITLSTISGTASFAQASLPSNIQVYAPAVIGTINIFIGILTTVQQYLKISELNEAHRVSSISWDKFARNIRIELSKAPHERMDAGHFIKLNRQEFDRLMETSPMIAASIIKEFNEKFKVRPNVPETKYFKELRKPDICDIIVSAERYKYGYKEKEDEIEIVIPDDKEEEENIMKKSTELMTNYFRKQLDEKNTIIENKVKEEDEKRSKKENLQRSFKKTVVELANRTKSQTKFLDDYVNTFKNMYGRRPIDEEIRTYANELIANNDIDESILLRFMAKYQHDDVMNIV
uniref:SMODS and SLOG-associating 2TM effector domain-containing protein n=1 Tax=viral metagenome TaxID=1070528 RepID=A0A6C0B8Z7_9ZZZZ